MLSKIYFSFAILLFWSSQAFSQRMVHFIFSDVDSCQIEIHLFSNQKYITTGIQKKQPFSFLAEKGKPYEVSVNPACGKAQFLFIKPIFKPLEDTTIHIQIEDSYLNLDEFVVKGEKNRFSYKGDTLVINTDSLSTIPQADGLEIFEEIKGLQISSTGQLSILGNRVTSAKINNRRILGGKPTENLANLKADMIEKLEFIVNPQTHEGTLHIILKKNKSKGLFGLVNLGLNEDPDHIASLKVNRLGNSTYQFFNINSDNVNYRFRDEILSEKGVGILQEAYRKGIYSHLSDIVLEETPLQVTNPEHGISERSQLKHAVNIENDVTEFNSILRMHRIQNTNQYTSSERINTQEFQTENSRLVQANLLTYQLNFEQDLKRKLGTKHQFWAKNTFDWIDELQKQEITFTTRLNNQQIGNFDSNQNQLGKTQINNQLDIALFLKPNWKGGKFLAHYQPVFSQTNNRGISKSIDSTTRFFQNRQVHFQQNIFLTTSYSIGKRIVNESRIIFKNHSFSTRNETSRGVSNLNQHISNFDIGQVFFYQHYRWNLSVQVGFNQLTAQRGINDSGQNVQNKLLGIRDIYWRKSFSNSRELIVSYQRKLELPPISDYFMIDDSLNPLAFQISNLQLQSFKTNQIRLTLSGSRAVKNNHSFSGEFQLDEGQPILSSTINQTQFITQLINSERIAYRAQLNWNIARSFSNIYADLVHTTNFGLFHSYSVFDGNYLNNQMQFVSFLTNFTEKLNKNLKWKIQSDNKFYFSTQPTRLLRQQIQLTYNYQKKAFLTVSGVHTNSKNGNNFTLNLEGSTFLGQRKNINASLVIQNLLNNQTVFEQFQLNHLILTSTNQALPFTALGKLTYYFEQFR